MKKSLKISIKFRLGEQLKPGFEGINLGKYSISPLPFEMSDIFKTEMLLNFEDEWKEGQQVSYHQKEGEIILSWLSMILKQKLKVNSVRINDIQIPNTQKEMISFESQIYFPENFNALYVKFKSLPLDEDNNLLEKYVRACECYQEALLLSTTNPTMSFYLFVVCIECLSNKDYNFYKYLMDKMSTKKEIPKTEIDTIYEEFNKEYGLKNNFIQFILSHLDKCKNDFPEEEFRKLLSSIYKIRSMFTHNGENLKKYIELVDIQLKSKSVFTKIGDKNVEFPGLNYFSHLVRNVLVNFLEKQKISEEDNIPTLALKENIVKLVANEPIQIGSNVTNNQIKHRK